MARYSFKEAVNYPPWVGSDYGKKGARRTLLIGRSYYDARYGQHNIPGYIQYLIKSGKEDPFFNSLETIVSEKQHWKRSLGGSHKFDRKKFWNSIAYHQYLQGILEEAYTVPTRQMWKEAQETLKRVILSLEPEVIAIFSFDVFDSIPTMGGRRGKDFSYNGDVMSTWEIQVQNKPASICRLMHPRKGNFRLDVWKNLYYQFMGDFKERNGKVYF